MLSFADNLVFWMQNMHILASDASDVSTTGPIADLCVL